jgi:16S rRNA processing protein RimM
MSSKSSKTENDLEGRGDLPETVTVGRVLRPHGVRGEVTVQVLSDVPGRFDKGSRVSGIREGEPPLPLEVATGRVHKTGAVVRFEGYEDRDRAEELRNLWRANGEELGRVVEVLEDGGGLLLIVEGGGRRVPVPFVKEFLREVDVAAARIDLELPPGLVETCASKS